MSENNNRRNILVVGVSSDEFARVAPFLQRDAFEIDRFPGGEGALEIIRHVALEVLIVRYPLPGSDIFYFLSQVRDPESPCRRSPLLLLADADHRAEAHKLIGKGANRVLGLEEAEEQIQGAVSSLLEVAPRKAARFITRLEIKLGGAKDMILCQTENISESGILIKTDRRYEKGTQIHFEFSLPEDQRPILGVAEVVRHTMIGRDAVGGIGMRFVSFSGDSQRRFQSFIKRL